MSRGDNRRRGRRRRYAPRLRAWADDGKVLKHRRPEETDAPIDTAETYPDETLGQDQDPSAP